MANPFGGGTKIKFKNPGAAKTFRLAFDTFAGQTSAYEGTNELSAARAIVNDELYQLGKNVLQPVYRSMAPYKGGAAEAAEWSSWADAGNHLRDKIRFQRNLSALSLTLVAPRQAEVTTLGRAGFSGAVYPIQLDGGAVIFRRRVDAATTHLEHRTFEASLQTSRQGKTYWRTMNEGRESGHDGRWRQEWMKRAWEKIRKEGWFNSAGQNMAIRIFLEVGYPKLKGILGAEMADVALQDFKNQPGISNIDSEGSQRFNYRTLTHAGKKGHPKSSAHARTLHAKRLGSRAAKLENRDGRGLSPHHSLAQGPAARRLSARNAARANHARELERIYNQHPYIPIGR